LKDDPGEWVNLAEKPGFKKIRDELAAALDHRQSSTRDPMRSVAEASREERRLGIKRRRL